VAKHQIDGVEMTNVRAAVTERPGLIRVREFPMPKLDKGSVLIKIHGSGICGTDKHTFRGESKQYAGTSHERDLTYPLICGHETVGEVVETGGVVLDNEGHALRPGERVVPAANVACGHCHFCLNAYPYYYCESMQDYGNSLHCGPAPHLFGGWSEYQYLLPRTPIFKVPNGLPDSVAALTEIISVTHGVETALGLLGLLGGGVRSGCSVAVLGNGPLGLCHLIKAKLLGAGRIIATDLFPSRLRQAEAFGADLTLNVRETETSERIARAREHTDGLGPDIVLSCSGLPETFLEALKMVRVGGIVVESGAFVDMGPVGVNPNSDICAKNVSVIGIGGETHTSYLTHMRLMQANLKRFPFGSIVTHRMPLESAQDGVELAQTDAAMKVMIVPNGERILV
jgi:threonine dehydrogenase-like Zn-dependent dehydrogenase